MVDATTESIQRTVREEQKFSILIPTWNSLEYLKLCVESIRKNATYKHQVIVHINEGKDGTYEWVKQQTDIDYTYSSENIGICYALNMSAQLAFTEYILYMNDDMYICPGWDEELWSEIAAICHPWFFLSSTCIEPFTKNQCFINANYGTDISSFNEKALVAEYNKVPKADWMGVIWPPNIVHKRVWDLVGGYSIEFSPGMYSDPDFSMKLWQLGIRLFKGVGKSRVYHFGSVSVKRVKKNKGYYQFISKWGMTSGTFSKYFMQTGKPFSGPGNAVEQPFFTKVKNVSKSMLSTFLNK